MNRWTFECVNGRVLVNTTDLEMCTNLLLVHRAQFCPQSKWFILWWLSFSYIVQNNETTTLVCVMTAFLLPDFYLVCHSVLSSNIFCFIFRFIVWWIENWNDLRFRLLIISLNARMLKRQFYYFLTNKEFRFLYFDIIVLMEAMEL